jgi:hypothetical protein
MWMSLLLTVGAFVSPSAPLDLSKDPKLQKVVSFASSAHAVQDILRTLSKEVNVPLSAEEPYAEDLLAVRFTDVPAYEVLQKLASHLHMEWQKDDGGYRLIKTSEERKKEEEDRFRQWLAPYENIQARLRKEIEDVKSGVLTEEKIREELKALAEKVQSRAPLPREEWEKFQQFQGLLDPAYKLAREVILSLEPRDWAQLEEWGVLVFSSRPTPMQRALPKIEDSILNEVIQGARQTYEQITLGREAPPPPYTFKVILSMPYGWGYLEAVPIVLGADGKALAQGSMDPALASPALSSYKQRFPFSGPPRTPTLRNDLTPRETRLDNAISVRGHMAALLLGDEYPEALSFIFEKSKKMDQEEPLGWMIGDLLLQVAEQTGVNLLSDLWDGYLRNTPSPRVGGRTGRQYLCALGDAFGAMVKEEGNWVRLEAQHRGWERQRHLPRRLLKTVATLVREQECLTLDQISALTSQVTLYQRFIQWLDWLLEPSAPITNRSTVRPVLEVLRFWNALNPAQKQSLRSGIPLEVNSLSPQGKAQLWKCILNLHSSLPAQNWDAFSDPTNLFPLGPEEGQVQCNPTPTWTLILRQRITELPGATRSICRTVGELPTGKEELEKRFDLSRIRYTEDRYLHLTFLALPWDYALTEVPLTFSPPVPFGSLPEDLRRLLEGGGAGLH